MKLHMSNRMTPLHAGSWRAEKPEMRERAILALQAHEAMRAGEITDLDDDMPLPDMEKYVVERGMCPGRDPEERPRDSADARETAVEQTCDRACARDEEIGVD